jgi:hypothetical protein
MNWQQESKHPPFLSCKPLQIISPHSHSWTRYRWEILTWPDLTKYAGRHYNSWNLVILSMPWQKSRSHNERMIALCSAVFQRNPIMRNSNNYGELFAWYKCYKLFTVMHSFFRAVIKIYIYMIYFYPLVCIFSGQNHQGCLETAKHMIKGRVPHKVVSVITTPRNYA